MRMERGQVIAFSFLAVRSYSDFVLSKVCQTIQTRNKQSKHTNLPSIPSLWKHSSRFPCRQRSQHTTVLTRILPGFQGNVVWGAQLGVVLAIGSAFGLMGFCGVKFNPVVSTTAFLLLGLGVDDAYVLIQAYHTAGMRLGPEATVRDMRCSRCRLRFHVSLLRSQGSRLY